MGGNSISANPSSHSLQSSSFSDAEVQGCCFSVPYLLSMMYKRLPAHTHSLTHTRTHTHTHTHTHVLTHALQFRQVDVASNEQNDLSASPPSLDLRLGALIPDPTNDEQDQKNKRKTIFFLMFVWASSVRGEVLLLASPRPNIMTKPPAWRWRWIDRYCVPRLLLSLSLSLSHSLATSLKPMCVLMSVCVSVHACLLC